MSKFHDVKVAPPPSQKPPPSPKAESAAHEPKKQKKQHQEKIPEQITWEAPEYVYYHKTSDWYWSLAILSLALIIVGVWQRNFLFIFLVIVGSFALALYAVRRPKTISITISGEGIRIDDRIYPYESIGSFWIFYRPGGVKELSLESEKMMMPYIKIPLAHVNPVEVRELLLEYIPEKAQEESLIDTIARLLKF